MAVTQFSDPAYLEAVFAALLTQLQTAQFEGSNAMQSWTRTVEAPDQIPVSNMPAAVLVQGDLLAEQKQVFGATKWTFSALLLIYLRADSSQVNPNPLPATLVNYFVWGIFKSLWGKPPYGKQTLGGLVEHAWLEGQVHQEVANEQLVIMIPIMILAGPSGAA